MTQDTSTYYVWIGGSCDYGHKERVGGAAVVTGRNGSIIYGSWAWLILLDYRRIIIK